MKFIDLYKCFFKNIILSYCAFLICSVIFLICNKELFSFEENSFWDYLVGNLTFASWSVCYINLLWIILMIFPFHHKEYSTRYNKFAKYFFTIPNTLAVVVNLIDVIYFRYTSRRTTLSVLKEFENENNIAKVFFREFVDNWYLLLIGGLIIFAIFKLYQKPNKLQKIYNSLDMIKYYAIRIVALFIVGILIVGAIRGGYKHSTRPLGMNDANRYVSSPSKTAFVLNTPFTILRTISKKVFENPNYYSSLEKAEKIFSPIHRAKDSVEFKNKNVVIFILESFGREFFGFYNKEILGEDYQGYTKFLDSLAEKSLTFKYSITNSRKSIDGNPSVLSSIPYFVEPFFTTSFATNTIDGIANQLKKKNYQTMYFHGAPNGSMSFDAFSRAAGFDKYFGLNEYAKLESYNKEKDFDGMWAIWDEEFLQFMLEELNKSQEPFCSAVFTASSHHPFEIPERYKNIFKNDSDNPLHRGIMYSDNAIKLFFEKAKTQEWYKNTIFVITNDHINQPDHPEYKTDMGLFTGPIIIFDPSNDSTFAQKRNCIANQIDIMPTVLGLINFDQDYFAYGQDLTSTPDSLTFGINYNSGIYQYYKNGYFLQFDSKESKAIYKLDDMLLKNNLIQNIDKDTLMQMETEVKALIQSYMQRMIENKLIVE